MCALTYGKRIFALDELLADAETRRLDGDETLSRYVFASNAKSLSEQIDLVWRMAASVQKVKSLRTPRMEKLVSASLKPCEGGCNDLWLRSAYNLLERNGVSILEFADIPVCGTCFSKMCLLGYNQQVLVLKFKLRHNGHFTVTILTLEILIVILNGHTITRSQRT